MAASGFKRPSDRGRAYSGGRIRPESIPLVSLSGSGRGARAGSDGAPSVLKTPGRSFLKKRRYMEEKGGEWHSYND